MSKKGLIIAIVACVACSVASFFIGFAIPRTSQDSGAGQSVKPTETTTEDSDDEYIGLYIANYYNNGTEINDKIRLGEGHNCKDPDSKASSSYSCTWAIEGQKLVMTTRGNGGRLGKTTSECDKTLQEEKDYLKQYTNYDGVIDYEVITLPEDYSSRKEGFICMVSAITQTKLDILSDGSLSNSHHTYYKR